MSDFFLTSFFSILLSAVLAGLLFGAIKVKASNWLLLLLGLLPVVFIYLWNPYARVYSYHGFMHTSIVYLIMGGNIPPSNPILAGEPLLYPWGHHLLVAGMTYALHVSPSTTFALLNVGALLLTLIIIFGIARIFASDRITPIFAACLSIFGASFITRGPIALLLRRLWPYIKMESKILPIAKFWTINSMPLGILLFVLFLYSILHIFSKLAHVRRYYAALVISVLGAGFFYPIAWLGLIASCFFSCTVMYFRHRRAILPTIVRVITCVTCGTLVVFPYLCQISSGKNEAATMRLAPRFHFVAINSFKFFWALLPISIILFVKRQTLLDLLRDRTDSTLILVATIIITSLMYILISAPTDAEYKYLLLASLPLGIIGSICLRDIYLKNRIICFLLVFSFLIPMGRAIWDMTRNWQVLDEFVEDGMFLRHSEPGEDALYRWIGSQTKRDAIFVDSQLTIPVFGRRQLYVGLDVRRESFGGSRLPRDGWGTTAETILKLVDGYPPEMIDARRRVASAIYSDVGTEIGNDVFSELNRMSETGDVYIVARDARTNDKLVTDDRFDQVFESNWTAVYNLHEVR